MPGELRLAGGNKSPSWVLQMANYFFLIAELVFLLPDLSVVFYDGRFLRMHLFACASIYVFLPFEKKVQTFI